MITPQRVQEIAEPIEGIYINCVNELLINIGRHITAPTWTHTASWEIQKLSEMGQLTRENAAIINRWIKLIPQTMRDTMEETRAAALDRLEEQMEKAAEKGYLTPPLADSTVQIMQDYADQAADKLNMVNTTMLQSSIQQYQRAIQLSVFDEERAAATQRILNEETGEVIVGTETHNKAVEKAINRIGREGLTGFYDRSGRSWTPEAYVNMVVRTTVHNTAIQATQTRMKDYGTDVFQISSHAGARPLCYPYQGWFCSWSNTSGEVELGDGRTVRYRPLSDTSYGQPAGIFGINCGHYPIVIIPGYTIPHGADNIQPKELNDKIYAESQQQRAIEREIRAAKRVVEMGDKSPEAKQRIKEAQARMRQFIDKTGRTRRYDREQIVTGEQKQKQQSAKSTNTGSARTAPTNRNGEQIRFNLDGMSDRNKDHVYDAISRLAEEYNTRLVSVRYVKPQKIQAEAGNVDISGANMELNKASFAHHEFMHTLSSSKGTKYGLNDDEQFWKEARKLFSEYKKSANRDQADKISEYSTKTVDEFMAESFSVMHGQKPADIIGSGKDSVYAKKALDLIDKYFKKG